MEVNTFYILLAVLFSIISIVTFIVVATFSKKLTIFSLFLTLIGIVGYNIVFVIEEMETRIYLDEPVFFWVFLIGMFCLAMNIIFAFWAVTIHARRKKLIFSAKEKYFKKYFGLIAHNDCMLLFNVKIRKILNNNHNFINRKAIYKLLRKEENPVFNLIVDGNEVEFNLEKKEIFYKDKLVGYAFVGSQDLLTKILVGHDTLDDKNILNKSALNAFDLTFDMSKDTVMYFDFKLEKYVLSNSMKVLLQEKDNYLTESKYQEKIVSSDLAIYLKREFNSDFINKYEYRVKTDKGILKFEELIYKDKDINYDIVRLSSRPHTEIIYLTKLNLAEDIKRNYLENNEFILITVELKTIAKIYVSDKQLGDLLTKNYFIILKEQYLPNKVYQLGKNQFAFLVSKDDGMRIKTDLENNCSLLTSMEIMLDDEKILVENIVSFIHANDIEEKIAANLIKIALEELYITSDADEEEPYSIYQSSNRDEYYKYEDMIIDLNDDDLDEFL